MPECDKCEYGQEITNTANLALSTATNGNVYVSDNPAVETSVPSAPEGKSRVIVTHAANHILRRIDAICKRPQSEKAPGNQQLQPDNMEVKVAEHTELHGRIHFPSWLCLTDGDCVEEVEAELHGKYADEETKTVHQSALGSDRSKRVTRLRDVVVEGQDWSGKVQR